MSNAIYLDLGPRILGYATEVAGQRVCVLSSRLGADRESGERVSRYMQAQGRDCAACAGCPIGKPA